MAKRRLTGWMRLRLEKHIEEKVDPPAERKALDAAYNKISPLVTKLVQRKYKPVDMAILAKYGVAWSSQCVKLTLPDARVVEFDFRDKNEGPLVPASYDVRSHMYLSDDTCMRALDAYEKTLETFKNETEKRQQAYRALIRAASAVEDIIEVWPEAAALLPATAVMAPLTPEQLALIRADTSERKVA